MYHSFADKLVVTGLQVSQAIDMHDANAAQIELTIYDLGGAVALLLDIQGSNDLQNWETLDSTSFPSTGFAYHQVQSIAFAYVRLRYDLDGPGAAIVAIGANTARL